MPPPQRIVIEKDFIVEVKDKLNSYAVSLATMRVNTPPLLSALRVEAGAGGYEPGTQLESAVRNAGSKLDERLMKLKDDLDLQVRRLQRLEADTDEVEALNTQEPSAIVNYLDPAFFKRGGGGTP